MVVIRRRSDSDLPQLAQVLVRVHAADGYPVEGVADPQAWLTPPREVAAWTALLPGQPIGQISLTRAADDDDAAILWQRATGGDIGKLVIPVRLFIDPPHRRLGAGAQLMLAAHSYSTIHSLAMAFDVMLKDQAAIQLYEAVGCRRIGIVEPHHSYGMVEPAAVYVAPAASIRGDPGQEI
jgi:GNAT superfamily N-acetyltransferase